MSGTLGELVRFGGVGGIATLTHFFVAWIFLFQGWQPYLANGMGFLVALWVSYWGHGRFTFRNFGRFIPLLMISGVGFALNNIALASLLRWGYIPEVLALLISILIIPLATFLGFKWWVYKPYS